MLALSVGESLHTINAIQKYPNSKPIKKIGFWKGYEAYFLAFQTRKPIFKK